MADYDNTNSGIIFQPHADQEFKGQGRLNIEGRESKCVLIREKLKADGDPVYVLYQKQAVFFPNDKEGNDARPDFSGPIDSNPDMRCAVWLGDKDGRKHMQIKVDYKQSAQGGSAPQTQPQVAAPAAKQFEDDIPF